jgi:hypothetical protein
VRKTDFGEWSQTEGKKRLKASPRGRHAAGGSGGGTTVAADVRADVEEKTEFVKGLVSSMMTGAGVFIEQQLSITNKKLDSLANEVTDTKRRSVAIVNV